MAKKFERVIIVIFENATRELVLANPYLNSLRTKGVFLDNSYGVTHPSQPNYIATLSGDTFGINGDDPFWVAPYPTTPDPNTQPPVTSIIDLLEAKKLTWKAYAENLRPVDIIQPPDIFFHPPPNFFYPPTAEKSGPGTDPLFSRRHVPFMSFPNIVTNPVRAANIVNAQSTFESDLAAGKLPNYSWYIPNLVNDGHSVLNSQGQPVTALPGEQNMENIAAFLKQFLGDDPLKRFPPKTLIVITFDEAFPYPEYDIYTLLIGDMLKPGSVQSQVNTHYTLLRSIEDNFGIGTLGRNDAASEPLHFLANLK